MSLILLLGSKSTQSVGRAAETEMLRNRAQHLPCQSSSGLKHVKLFIKKIILAIVSQGVKQSFQ